MIFFHMDMQSRRQIWKGSCKRADLAILPACRALVGRKNLTESTLLKLKLSFQYPHHSTICIHFDEIIVAYSLRCVIGTDDAGNIEFASDNRRMTSDTAKVGDDSHTSSDCRHEVRRGHRRHDYVAVIYFVDLIDIFYNLCPSHRLASASDHTSDFEFSLSLHSLGEENLAAVDFDTVLEICGDRA